MEPLEAYLEVWSEELQFDLSQNFVLDPQNICRKLFPANRKSTPRGDKIIVQESDHHVGIRLLFAVRITLLIFYPLHVKCVKF